MASRKVVGLAPVVLFWRVAIGVGVLSAWQLLVALKLLDPFFVSRPSAIAQRIAQWVISGSLWGHLAITLEESLLGLIIGAATGISLGFSFGRSPMLASIFDPYIKMLNAVPRVVPEVFDDTRALDVATFLFELFHSAEVEESFSAGVFPAHTTPNVLLGLVLHVKSQFALHFVFNPVDAKKRRDPSCHSSKHEQPPP